jgi:hypothetical protein
LEAEELDGVHLSGLLPACLAELRAAVNARDKSADWPDVEIRGDHVILVSQARQAFLDWVGGLPAEVLEMVVGGVATRTGPRPVPVMLLAALDRLRRRAEEEVAGKKPLDPETAAVDAWVRRRAEDERHARHVDQQERASEAYREAKEAGVIPLDDDDPDPLKPR